MSEMRWALVASDGPSAANCAAVGGLSKVPLSFNAFVWRVLFVNPHSGCLFQRYLIGSQQPRQRGQYGTKNQQKDQQQHKAEDKPAVQSARRCHGLGRIMHLDIM